MVLVRRVDMLVGNLPAAPAQRQEQCAERILYRGFSHDRTFRHLPLYPAAATRLGTGQDASGLHHCIRFRPILFGQASAGAMEERAGKWACIIAGGALSVMTFGEWFAHAGAVREITGPFDSPAGVAICIAALFPFLLTEAFRTRGKYRIAFFDLY